MGPPPRQNTSIRDEDKVLMAPATCRGTISVIAPLYFRKASFAEAFHIRPIFFPFLCLGKFFNISIKGVAWPATKGAVQCKKKNLNQRGSYGGVVLDISRIIVGESQEPSEVLSVFWFFPTLKR